MFLFVVLYAASWLTGKVVYTTFSLSKTDGDFDKLLSSLNVTSLVGVLLVMICAFYGDGDGVDYYCFSNDELLLLMLLSS